MFLIALLMLLAPGLISIRILWNNKDIKREDYKFLVCDYVIYSFLIHTAVYGLLTFTHPGRTVSFVTDVGAVSHILRAGFVFNYSVVSLAAAIVLPAFVPWLTKFWLNLEDNRSKRRERKNKEIDKNEC